MRSAFRVGGDPGAESCDLAPYGVEPCEVQPREPDSHRNDGDDLSAHASLALCLEAQRR